MMDGWMDRQMDKVIGRWKVELLDGWIGGSWVDGIKEKWVDGLMDGWMSG